MKIIELPKFGRSASLRPQSFDEADNSVEVVWTTGASVRRHSPTIGPFDEELIVTPEAVRLDRLNAGAPFLNTHSDWSLEDVIGSVVPGTARIEGGKGLARVRLSRAPSDANNVLKIREGIIRSVSVGYIIHRAERIVRGDEVPIVRALAWEPLELSAVPIPADPGAGVRSGVFQSVCEVRDGGRTSLHRAEISELRERMELRAKVWGLRDA